MRNRLAIRYAVEGDLRFLSHHDSLRLFRRALARAGLPVRFSEGFNPRPRLSIVLPRPVGVASRDELLIVELTSHDDPSGLLARVSAQMPRGIRLLTACWLENGDRRLPCEVQYSLKLDPNTCESTAQSVSEFIAQEHVVVERTVGGRGKKIDVRGFLSAVELSGGALHWTQAVTPEGTARVGEVLDSLGLPSREHLHRVLRRKVTYRP